MNIDMGAVECSLTVPHKVHLLMHIQDLVSYKRGEPKSASKRDYRPKVFEIFCHSGGDEMQAVKRYMF